MKHEKKGIKRILSAFKNSFDGFLFAFREEEAFRQDLLFFVIGLVLMFVFDFSIIERVILFSGLFFILFAEIVNSSIEACIDRISSDWHKLSKATKDMGSLLVLFSFVYFFVVWISIFSKFL
ncbi:diacylglycerol kinase [bacterium]|nr:diacylglycerol kinase [bacterium]